MGSVGQVSVLVSGFDTSEGPTFDRQGNLFFVNSSTSSIMKRAVDGTVTEFANTGGIPAGLAFHRDGSLYVADEGDGHHGVLRVTKDGQIETVIDAYLGRPLNGANDLVFDRDGTLYFSDPWGSSAENPIGGFYRLFADGRLERIDDGLAFPNGVAVNAEGTAVFLAETYRTRILRYRLRPGESVGEREVFAEVGGPPGPDGMAFDVDGNLYVAHFDGGRVDVLDPTGRLLAPIPVPGRQPTNVAFGGQARRTLVITEYETHAIYQTEVAIPGRPLFGEVSD
jgi:gluconolactonase